MNKGKGQYIVLTRDITVTFLMTDIIKYKGEIFWMQIDPLIPFLYSDSSMRVVDTYQGTMSYNDSRDEFYKPLTGKLMDLLFK